MRLPPHPSHTMTLLLIFYLETVISEHVQHFLSTFEGESKRGVSMKTLVLLLLGEFRIPHICVARIHCQYLKIAQHLQCLGILLTDVPVSLLTLSFGA